MSASGSSDLPNFSLGPHQYMALSGNQALQQQQSQIGSNQLMSYPGESNLFKQQMDLQGYASEPAASNEQPVRPDVNPQGELASGWPQSASSLAPLQQMSPGPEFFGGQLAQNQQSNLILQPATSNQLTHQQQQQQQQQLQLQQSLRRRFGELDTVKPVHLGELEHTSETTVGQIGSNQNSASSLSGLFSSLTSGGSRWPTSRIMNKIMSSVKLDGSPDFVKSAAASASNKLAELGSIYSRKDQLSDKHRYSLVGLDGDSEPLAFGGFGGHGNHGAGSTASKLQRALLLSTLTRAIQGLSPNQADGSGSWSGQDQVRQVGAISRQGVEQRDLTQLLPNSWREAVKRTMSSVQQQASNQWRSIEGQLTGWVQEKLKALPVPASLAPGAIQSNNSATGSAAPAQVTNLIATVGSTAMNMLGLGAKSQTGSGASNQASSSEPAAANSSQTSAQQRNKVEAPAKGAPTAKGPLATMAESIVSTLAGKLAPANDQAKLQTSPSAESTAQAASTAAGSSSSTTAIAL